jgi:hypothetical protein
LVVAGVLLSGASLAGTEAQAGVSISVGIGGPPIYYGYDYSRPCWWYRERALPAPRRCYRYFYGIYGPSLFVDGDFIFRDRDDYGRWRDRDDYRRWRGHDFHRDYDRWHDHGGHEHDGHDHHH